MFLILSIFCSTLIFIIFKSFDKYKVNTLHAIIFNYFTAASFGYLTSDEPVIPSTIITSNWFIGAIVLGFLFISVFNVMALTTQKNGLSVASVFSKMGVIIPVVFGIYFYNETLNFQKSIGIILALVAVYFTSVKAKSSKSIELKNLTLPMLLFFGSGIIETLLNYIKTSYLAENEISIFSATIFLIAGLIGIILLSISSLKNKIVLSYTSVIGGIILGIVNYYSIYTLIKVLNNEAWESSTIFTINNVAIVTLSTLIGLVIFKEKLLKKNWIGIGIAVISIVLVTFA